MPDSAAINTTPSGLITTDGLLSPFMWADRILYYAFPTSASQYGNDYPAPNFLVGFTAFSSAYRAMAVYWLQQISNFTGLTFIEGSGSDSALRFGRFDDPGNGAYAFYPGIGAGGDMWFANNQNVASLPGGTVYHITLHEIGHALGLEHPFEGSVTLPREFDTVTYTSLAYNFSPSLSNSEVFSISDGDWSQSLTLLDTAALQYLYGANFNFNSGDNVYTFDPASGQMFVDGVSQGEVLGNRVFRTIWDGGGIDTYDFSNYSGDQTVSLVPGEWSLFSQGQLTRAYGTLNDSGNIDWVMRPGNILNALLYQGDTRSLIENLITGIGNDQITGNAAANHLTGGLGNDTLNGGSNVDTAIVRGLRSQYTVTQTATGIFEVVGPDGTDTLTAIEFLQFDDQTIRLLPGTGVSVNFNTSNPAVYQTAMNAIRDFDGNALGGNGSWLRIGQADVNGDGDIDQILVNRAIGRFATVGTAPDGLVYFADYGWAGETRVAGIYIDPLVAAGIVERFGPNDSQRRFQNDLQIENINRVLGADDYDNDGLQEVYFALTDGTAYLRAIMEFDGNIRYANYQSQQEVIDYLTANGFGPETWAGWFTQPSAGEATLGAEQVFAVQETGGRGAIGAPAADLLAGLGDLALAPQNPHSGLFMEQYLRAEFV